jgi:hypothetical protein
VLDSRRRVLVLLWRDPKADTAAVAGDEALRLTVVLVGWGESNKTKSCWGGLWKLCCCADGAGWLEELEGGHVD